VRRLAVLLLAGAAGAAQAGDIQVDARDIYYEVSGTTAAAILDDLRRQARNADKDYFAEALWHVRWKYDYDQPVRNVCRVKNLRLDLIQRTTLPRWSVAGAAPELVARWQGFLDALRVHEKGHSEHGTGAAQAIRDAVLPLRAATCAELAAEVNRTAAAIIDKFGALDAAYDADTRHGISQGAYWGAETVPVSTRASPRPRSLPVPRPQPEQVSRPELEQMPRLERVPATRP
jgi:predicted secreted Zn-dependent protease